MTAKKDTDKLADAKLKQALSIFELLRKIRGNPIVLLIAAVGGGLISQETLQNIGQNVQWWWVALGVAGFAAVDFATTVVKKVDRAAEDVAEIKALLRIGHEKHVEHDREIAALKEWRAQQALRDRRKKPNSKGALARMSEETVVSKRVEDLDDEPTLEPNDE